MLLSGLACYVVGDHAVAPRDAGDGMVVPKGVQSSVVVDDTLRYLASSISAP